jgi:drug/metabolite transporter (DMT)-like permease
MLFYLFIIITLFANSSLGAMISKEIQGKNLPWYACSLSGCFGGLIWGYMSNSGRPLIYMSILFDVITALTYITIFAYLGESITRTHVLGILFSLFGVFLLSK